MLIGEFTHSIDTKNRCALPAKFRKEMGKKVVVTRGLDSCLSVYTVSSWKKISEKLESLSMTKANERAFNRFMLSGAVEVDVDSQGRILVPDYLQEFAKIDKKVVWTGAGDKAEIWAEETWSKYVSSVQESPETLAESLEGII